MKRVVLCGFGRFGRVYAQRAQEHLALDVVGVVELAAVHDAVRAAGFRPFDSLGEALDVTHPQLVVVATPPANHAALAVEALQRYVDVMLANLLVKLSGVLDVFQNLFHFSSQPVFGRCHRGCSGCSHGRFARCCQASRTSGLGLAQAHTRRWLHAERARSAVLQDHPSLTRFFLSFPNHPNWSPPCC